MCSQHAPQVDKGFVAQVADVDTGRTAPMSPLQKAEAAAKVPLEVDARVKHVRRGLLSMARWDGEGAQG